MPLPKPRRQPISRRNRRSRARSLSPGKLSRRARRRRASRLSLNTVREARGERQWAIGKALSERLEGSLLGKKDVWPGRGLDSDHPDHRLSAVRAEATAGDRAPGRKGGEGLQGDGGRSQENRGARSQFDSTRSQDGRAGFGGLHEGGGRGDQRRHEAGPGRTKSE